MKKLTALIMAAVLTAGAFSDAALAAEAQGQDQIATEIESQESESDDTAAESQESGDMTAELEQDTAEEELIVLEEPETDAGISFVDVSKSTGIPILNINLKEVSLSTINSGEKDEKYPGNTVAITDVDGTVSTYVDVELKGRGNSTWLQAKKPYQIKFSSKENLFNLGKSKTYILLADYLDSTSIRNDATFTIAREMGMAYTNKGTWVDLYVDGSYLGLYYLCHKTKIGSSEVDLSDPKGCLVELDDQKMEPDEIVYKTATYKRCLLLKDSVDESAAGQSSAMSSFLSAYNALEKAARDHDWTAFCEVADARSFAEYLLIQEITCNPDGYGSSVYYYKDGDADTIHAGPVWDYDLAYGNTRNPWNTATREIYSNHKSSITWEEVSRLYRELMEIEEFRALVCEVYQERGHAAISTALAKISSDRTMLAAALEKNGARWSASNNYSSHYEMLLEWLTGRQKVLDSFYCYEPAIQYQTQVQSEGWMHYSFEGKISGTIGRGLRMEAIQIRLANLADYPDSGITYQSHVQTYGWQDWVTNNKVSGTTGESKRLEAIRIKLTGSVAEDYSVYYRVHAQTYGWMGWARDGQTAGTSGYGKRLEAIEIALVKKGDPAPGDTAQAYVSSTGHVHEFITDAYVAPTCTEAGYEDTSCWCGEGTRGEIPAAHIWDGGMVTTEPTDETEGSIRYTCTLCKATRDEVLEPLRSIAVKYQTHVQTYGWQPEVSDGDVAGTSGEAKRLESIRIRLDNKTHETDGITYRTHVQTYGWQKFVTDGADSGTTGLAKRLEAIEIKLTGQIAEKYDVYYCVHSQTYGWLGWAKNGEAAGTQGLAKRLEAIRIVLIPKGESAPEPVGTRKEAFIKK